VETNTKSQLSTRISAWKSALDQSPKGFPSSTAFSSQIAVSCCCRGTVQEMAVLDTANQDTSLQTVHYRILQLCALDDWWHYWVHMENPSARVRFCQLPKLTWKCFTLARSFTGTYVLLCSGENEAVLRVFNQLTIINQFRTQTRRMLAGFEDASSF